jgi:chitodextrinase
MKTYLSLFIVACACCLPAEAATRDRTPPTKPGNFRVTAITAGSVTLAWSPSTDNSGNFSYTITSSANLSERYTLPKTATSFTFTKFLHQGNRYTFTIKAVDAAGNSSSTASVSATLPTDTTPPSAPVLATTEIGSRLVSLAWEPGDDDPSVNYDFYINTSLFWNLGTNRTVTVNGLIPTTTYTFNVRARDAAGNVSPLSNPVTVTTAPDTTDLIPPTTPGNLTFTVGASCEEGNLTWTQSTDNFAAQKDIRYDVYVNGELFDWQFGSGGPSSVYGNPGESNVFEVIAVDTYGNESEPARLELVLCQ